MITGATSGIGNEFLRIFAERGYDLFLMSRNEEKMNGIRKKFADVCGSAVRTMRIDLAKPSAAGRVYEETVAQEIEIQMLVHNAGVGLAGLHADLDAGKVKEMIQLNVITLAELCSLFGRGMKERGGGFILNVASAAAYQPTPYTAVYGATKSYVLNFPEALAKQRKDYNVAVTCLSPISTDTNFFDHVGVEGVRERKKGIWAKKNLMESREVAEIGVQALLAEKLSVIAGTANSLLAFSNRLVPAATPPAFPKS